MRFAIIAIFGLFFVLAAHFLGVGFWPAMALNFLGYIEGRLVGEMGQ